MQLTVSPDDLYAAAVAIRATASRLEEATTAFASRTAADGPALGCDAAAAVRDGARIVVRAAGVVTDDIRQISTALQLLASLYPRVDGTAVRR